MRNIILLFILILIPQYSFAQNIDKRIKLLNQALEEEEQKQILSSFQEGKAHITLKQLATLAKEREGTAQQETIKTISRIGKAHPKKTLKILFKFSKKEFSSLTRIISLQEISKFKAVYLESWHDDILSMSLYGEHPYIRKISLGCLLRIMSKSRMSWAFDNFIDIYKNTKSNTSKKKDLLHILLLLSQEDITDTRKIASIFYYAMPNTERSSPREPNPFYIKSHLFSFGKNHIKRNPTCFKTDEFIDELLYICNYADNKNQKRDFIFSFLSAYAFELASSSKKISSIKTFLKKEQDSRNRTVLIRSIPRCFNSKEKMKLISEVKKSIETDEIGYAIKYFTRDIPKKEAFNLLVYALNFKDNPSTQRSAIYEIDTRIRKMRREAKLDKEFKQYILNAILKRRKNVKEENMARFNKLVYLIISVKDH